MSKFKDITGEVYNLLTVESFSHKNKHGQSMWNCVCICGKTTIVQIGNLTSGEVASCGCLQHKKRAREDLTGRKFGKLTVTRFSHMNKFNRPMWECLCDCGRTKIADASYLKNGDVLSCGCLSSKMEEEVRVFCEKQNIFFIKEYALPREKNGKTTYLRIDFLVEYKGLSIAIECQGQQHYDPKSIFYSKSPDRTLDSLQERDREKRSILEIRNIPLIEIHYKEKDIERFLLSTLEEVYQQECRGGGYA